MGLCPSRAVAQSRLVEGWLTDYRHVPLNDLLFARPQINTAIVSATLGAALAAQRQLVDLTQHAAALRASISTGHLRAVEKGSRQPIRMTQR